MFERIRNHSGKIYIVIINCLLATIGVLLIKEKDQSRVLEQAVKSSQQQDELPPVQDVGNNDVELQSFESNLDFSDSGTAPAPSSSANTSSVKKPQTTSATTKNTAAPSTAPKKSSSSSSSSKSSSSSSQSNQSSGSNSMTKTS